MKRRQLLIGTVVVAATVVFASAMGVTGHFAGTLLGGTGTSEERVKRYTDTNGDGRLDIREMRTALRRVIAGVAARNSAFDVDGIHGIDRDDIREMVRLLRAFLAAQCGNGVREVGEQCDDGNTVSGDGCSSVCAAEAGPTITVTQPVSDIVLGALPESLVWDTTGISMDTSKFSIEYLDETSATHHLTIVTPSSSASTRTLAIAAFADQSACTAFIAAASYTTVNQCFSDQGLYPALWMQTNDSFAQIFSVPTGSRTTSIRLKVRELVSGLPHDESVAAGQNWSGGTFSGVEGLSAPFFIDVAAHPLAVCANDAGQTLPPLSLPHNGYDSASMMAKDNTLFAAAGTVMGADGRLSNPVYQFGPDGWQQIASLLYPNGGVGADAMLFTYGGQLHVLQVDRTPWSSLASAGIIVHVWHQEHDGSWSRFLDYAVSKPDLFGHADDRPQYVYGRYPVAYGDRIAGVFASLANTGLLLSYQHRNVTYVIDAGGAVTCHRSSASIPLDQTGMRGALPPVPAFAGGGSAAFSSVISQCQTDGFTDLPAPADTAFRAVNRPEFFRGTLYAQTSNNGVQKVQNGVWVPVGTGVSGDTNRLFSLGDILVIGGDGYVQSVDDGGAALSAAIPSNTYLTDATHFGAKNYFLDSANNTYVQSGSSLVRILTTLPFGLSGGFTSSADHLFVSDNRTLYRLNAAADGWDVVFTDAAFGPEWRYFSDILAMPDGTMFVGDDDRVLRYANGSLTDTGLDGNALYGINRTAFPDPPYHYETLELFLVDGVLHAAVGSQVMKFTGASWLNVFTLHQKDFNIFTDRYVPGLGVSFRTHDRILKCIDMRSTD